MTEASKKPNRKVVAGGLAGAVTSILVWLAPSLFPNMEIPPEIAASITTVVFAAVSYFVPN
jgi:hypothetical protein